MQNVNRQTMRMSLVEIMMTWLTMRMEVAKQDPKMKVVSMPAPGMMVDVTGKQAMRMTTPRMMVVVRTALGMGVYMTRKAVKKRLRIETRKN
jgi:hypothetical protein